MKRSSILFLKAVLLLITVAMSFFMIRFPQTEGRATNLDLISIYKDPFIIYIYIALIPFFAALYQTFKLLNHIDKNKIFSQASIKTVKNIKHYVIIFIIFIVVAVIYLFITQRGKDDIAGGVVTGIFITFASFIIVATTNVFEGILQKAITKQKKG